MTKIVNSADPFDEEWVVYYLKIQVKKVEKLLEEYPDSETYKKVLKIWSDKVAKYESRI